MSKSVPETAGAEPSLAELRATAEETAATAEEARKALMDAAVAAATSSTRYGHLSKTAREAGIHPQVLREVIESRHPGWLAKAAEKREKEKAAREAGKTRTRRSQDAA
ncbi:hypothetical protein M1P56_35365 (plasmid) [Streptomyces sp. HU2014]|uniref:hypothetical protein n=1 Tax=Streptomyces sp. HU2014 TaxID=2939414 RepID=UPI00200CAA53|nr:hypothetical protein [Streptomyces sp. HU2014]UQI49671.1 hypothetical protein M1P56_35365 [Streptomyces sp. HU2014]